jgi:hypothetical protein
MLPPHSILYFGGAYCFHDAHSIGHKKFSLSGEVLTVPGKKSCRKGRLQLGKKRGDATPIITLA